MTMPLNADDYAAGRRVRSPEGDDLDVRDTLTGGSGNHFLVVTHPDNPDFGLLVASATVRDTFESRDPEEVQEERAQEYDRRENPPEDVTDEPGVTDTPESGSTPTPANG